MTEPNAASHLTVWPAGQPRPVASNLNFAPGDTIANLVVVEVEDGGTVGLYNNNGATHVVADLAGWFAGPGDSSDGAAYAALTPARILDTRAGDGAPARMVGAGGTLRLRVTGRGGVPSSGVSPSP